jgi:hypothetical protein
VEWLARFAEVLGTEMPTEGERNLLLELAGVAAHASERTAAPVACWLAGRSGMELVEALELAQRVTTGEGKDHQAPS